MINNELDDVDKAILNLLQENSRIFHKDIAEKLHKSVNAIYARIRQLETLGYIKKYTVIVDHKKVGRGLVAFTQVQVNQHTEENLKAFQREVIKLSEVLECSHMTGSFDFLLKIAIRDMDEYHDLFMNKLAKLPDVGNMQTFFVMGEAKHETAYIL